MAPASDNSQSGRRPLLCFSFVSLCFFQTWVALALPDQIYYRKYSPLVTVVLPTLAWEALLFSLLIGAWRASDFFKKPWQRTGICIFGLLACLIPAGFAGKFLTIQAERHLSLSSHHGLYSVTAGALSLALIFCFPRLVAPFVRRVFLLAIPVELFLYACVLWTCVVGLPPSAYADKPAPPPPTGTPPTQRVVWFIFDEMSQRTAFEARPTDVMLPNFDRLRAGSLYSDAAYPPAGFTELSIRSLLLGRVVQASHDGFRLGFRVHPVYFPSQIDAASLKEESWSIQPNVFDDIRRLGGRTAAAGWFHPYGRILRHSLDECCWVPAWLQPGGEEPYDPPSFWAIMKFRLHTQLMQMPFSARFPALDRVRLYRKEKVREYEFLRREAMRLAADPSLTLVFLHMPLPHPPGIYSRLENRLCYDCASTYLDNLVLADHLLGDVRRSMEQAGIWDSSCVIVSADHSWRLHLWRLTPQWTAEEEQAGGNVESKLVPFMLKLPNQHDPLAFSQRYETVNTRRLIDAVVNEKVTTPAEAERLLAQSHF